MGEWPTDYLESGSVSFAKRITKKLLAARAAFRKRVCNFLKAMGASESDRSYEWKLSTPYGELDISLWDNAIMCRFVDVKQGTDFTCGYTSQSCNPYSGKWNWHFDDDADTLNGNCDAQFVRYVTLLMSLGTLPADLTKLTAVQSEWCVTRLTNFPLVELRRRQDITNRQIELAFKQRDDASLGNLRVRAEHLRMAVDRQGFGVDSDDRCGAVHKLRRN